MTTSNHPVFATMSEAPAVTDWELTGDVFGEQWADENADQESTDFEGVEWEAPYSSGSETSYADESSWDTEESDWGAEDSSWSTEELDWGAEMPDFEEAGPGYEENYEQSDWPQEFPDVAAASLTNTVVISDYPRYATSVTDLRPDQVASLRSLANGIVGALLANHRVSVVVEGFADFDAKGRDFEQQVSIDRAIGRATSSSMKFIEWPRQPHFLLRHSSNSHRKVQHSDQGVRVFKSQHRRRTAAESSRTHRIGEHAPAAPRRPTI